MKHMIVLLALVGAPISAQPSGTEIVVEGRNVSPDEAREYVAQVTDTRDGQVARFQRPVCPAIVGLPDEMNRKIAARIRNTAQSVGAKVAPEQCDANLVVLVADDSGSSISDLQRSRDSWFEGLSASEIDALISDKAPARSWAVVSLRNEDGERVHDVTERNEPRSMRVKSASILRNVTRLDVEGAVVVIERSAADGKSVAQIADYAAMRGLARTRPPQAISLPTILTLFENASGSSISGLTSFDQNYLRALYRFSGTESLSDARSRLSREVRQGR